MNNIFAQNTVHTIVFKLSDLLKSENLKIAIAQLCDDLQVYNFSIAVTKVFKVGESHIKTNHCKCNSFYVTSDLLNSDNLKIAIAQLWNDLQVCNIIML